jgi:DNA-binding transcriptional LysR family regulator
MQQSPTDGIVLQQMTTFVRIADAGNISRAARSLRLSVAMASRHLRWLEVELGAPLMRRTTRRVDLTEAGQELLIRARAILAGIDEARATIRPGPGVAGRVVLSVPTSMGLQRIASLIPALLDNHPRLRVEIRCEDRPVDLLEDGVDIAIRAGRPPPDSPFVVARQLVRFERVVCAAPKLLAKCGRIDSVAKLSELPCVVHGAPPTVWDFQTPEGPVSVVVDGRLRTNNLLLVRDAVVAGAGIGWLPSWLADEHLRARQLKPVLSGSKLPPVEVYALFHTHARGATAVRTVIDYFARKLAASVGMSPPSAR